MRNVVIALISFCVCFDLVPSISIAGEVPSLANHVQIQDACDFEPEKRCIDELNRLCGSPPENNPECIKKNSSYLMKKTISFRKCVRNIYVRCSKGKKCSSRNIEDLCKW